MKKSTAIDLAGGAPQLAALLGITWSAVSQWGDDVPQAREWQLRVIRPQWFSDVPTPPDAAAQEAA